MIQSLGASAAIQVSLFVSGIIMARGLGPAPRGDLAVILILPSVATQLVCFGLPAAATYFVARDVSQCRSIAITLIRTGVVQIIGSVLLLLFLNQAFLGDRGSETTDAARLAVVSAPLLVIQYYGLAILQGLGDLRLFNIYRFMAPAAFSVGLIAAVLAGLTILSSTVVWIVTLGATTAVMMAHIAKLPGMARQPNSGIEGVSSGRMRRFAAAGFLAQVSPVETFRIDTLVVAALFPAQVVGYYAVAASLSNVPRFIADGLAAVAYPRVAGQGAADGLATSWRFLAVAVLLCGGASALIAIAIPVLVPLLFGSAFTPAEVIAALLLLAATLISVRRVATDCVRALGYPGATTVVEVVTLASLALSLGVMATWENAEGVATALSVSAAIGLAALTLLLVRLSERTSPR